MRLMIVGCNGQVGFELQRALAPLGNVVATDRHTCDIAKPDSIRAAVRACLPNVIVNASAYTAVDKAESELDLAFAINARGPGILAEEAVKANALLIHYSTDYVYDGRKATPYVEADATNPQSVYGRSKLAGEEAIRAIGGAHVILRTCWVFGSHGGNFLKTILRLAKERDSLKVVADQFGAPTSAALIADCTATIVKNHGSSKQIGTFHLAAAGETTWHGYAQWIVREAHRLGIVMKLNADAIEAIPASEYPLPAPRPANSRLNTTAVREIFGVELPEWRVGALDVLQKLYREERK